LTLNNKGYYPVWTVNVGKKPKVSSQNNLTGVIAEAGTYQVEVRMGNRNGISEGSKILEIVIENTIGGDDFTGFKYDTEFNLWKNCEITEVSYWFANNDWGQIGDPSIDIEKEGFSFILPAEMGTQQWQGQVHMWTNVAAYESKRYDFCCTLLCSDDAPSVTIKVQKGDSLGDDTADDEVFFNVNVVALKANVPYTFFFEDLPGIETSNIQICCDFGGTPEGAEVSLSNIHLQEHL
ncbi:MAG: hypothetical protein K2F70_05860, partial [Muribaculaceae bacterium]|nr:hypothetical protein [Muribaculaceae bacterium]